MVKFASSVDGGYEKVSGHLWLLVSEAPDAIGIRWADQDKIRIGTEKHPGLIQQKVFVQVMTIIGSVRKYKR